MYYALKNIDKSRIVELEKFIRSCGFELEKKSDSYQLWNKDKVLMISIRLNENFMLLFQTMPCVDENKSYEGEVKNILKGLFDFAIEKEFYDAFCRKLNVKL